MFFQAIFLWFEQAFLGLLGTAGSMLTIQLSSTLACAMYEAPCLVFRGLEGG